MAIGAPILSGVPPPESASPAPGFAIHPPAGKAPTILRQALGPDGRVRAHAVEHVLLAGMRSVTHAPA
jgi:hypothetical protein